VPEQKAGKACESEGKKWNERIDPLPTRYTRALDKRGLKPAVRLKIGPQTILFQETIYELAEKRKGSAAEGRN